MSNNGGDRHNLLKKEAELIFILKKNTTILNRRKIKYHTKAQFTDVAN